MKWEITYFNQAVFSTLEGMPKKIKARYIVLTDRMEVFGANLGFPHTKSIGAGLFELRIKAEEGIARVFYCTCVNNEIVMLHSFIKKTQVIPKKELAIARKRLAEVLKK